MSNKCLNVDIFGNCYFGLIINVKFLLFLRYLVLELIFLCLSCLLFFSHAIFGCVGEKGQNPRNIRKKMSIVCQDKRETRARTRLTKAMFNLVFNRSRNKGRQSNMVCDILWQDHVQGCILGRTTMQSSGVARTQPS